MAEATLCAKHNARYLHHAARLPRVGHIRSVGRSVGEEVRNLFLRRGQRGLPPARDSWQHRPHSQTQKAREGCKSSSCAVEVRLGEPERLPQEKISSAALPAEHRRHCTERAAADGRKKNVWRKTQLWGGKRGTFNRHSGADSWRSSSRAAAPLDLRSRLGLARVTPVTLFKRRCRRCWSYNIDCVVDLYWRGDRDTSCSSQPAQLSVYIPVRGQNTPPLTHAALAHGGY